MNQPHEISPLVKKYNESGIARAWKKLWRMFPGFSSKHSPFFPFPDGLILWDQGFGKMAFLKGNRSVTVSWKLGDRRPYNLIVCLSDVNHWDPPHESEVVSNAELEDLRHRMQKCFDARSETVAFE